MADLIQSYNGTQNLLMTLRQVLRGVGHSLLPSFIEPEPYVAIGNGMKLSEAYAILVRTGRLPAIRATNAAIKQRHFELTNGMVPPPPKRTPMRAYVITALVALAATTSALVCLRAPEADAAAKMVDPAPSAARLADGLNGSGRCAGAGVN